MTAEALILIDRRSENDININPYKFSVCDNVLEI